jgi:uncharacterized membrane-anchored protein YjiN (DUF445 family)
MAIIYVLCEVSFAQYTWSAYVKAFAEAGMVGALADWFCRIVALLQTPVRHSYSPHHLIEEQ